MDTMNKISIYTRKDGRFEGRKYLGCTIDGKRRYKSFYGSSKDEVIKKYENFCYSFDRNCQLTEMTVSQMAYEWLNATNNHIKRSTYANYMMKIKKHILPVFGNAICSKVKSKDIYSFIETLRDKGLSSRYISDIIILIKAIYKYASRE